MYGSKIPGFTATSTLYNASSFLQGTELARASGPFSGSCGCWPGGLCCCILCWYNTCFWWCWAPSRVPIGF